jgi:hypothetical protein
MRKPRLARFSTDFIYQFPENQSVCDILYFGGNNFKIDEPDETAALTWNYNDTLIILNRLGKYIGQIEDKIKWIKADSDGTQQLYFALSNIPEYYRLGAMLYHQLKYQSKLIVEFDY